MPFKAPCREQKRNSIHPDTGAKCYSVFILRGFRGGARFYRKYLPCQKASAIAGGFIRPEIREIMRHLSGEK